MATRPCTSPPLCIGVGDGVWAKLQQTFFQASLNRALNPASTACLNVLHATRRPDATLRQLPNAMNSSTGRQSSGERFPDRRIGIRIGSVGEFSTTIFI